MTLISVTVQAGHIQSGRWLYVITSGLDASPFTESQISYHDARPIRTRHKATGIWISIIALAGYFQWVAWRMPKIAGRWNLRWQFGK
jgi:hypothetical protein